MIFLESLILMLYLYAFELRVVGADKGDAEAVQMEFEKGGQADASF